MEDCMSVEYNDEKRPQTSIFYDDVTHVKLFTKVSLNQILQLRNFKEIEFFKFRQLPITGSNPFALAISKLTSMFTPPRVKQKWFRWSRELMLASVGKNIN